MKKKLNYIFSLLVVLIISSCGTSTEEDNTTTPAGHIISGTIDGAEGNMIRLMVFEDGKEAMIDSAKITGGKFELKTRTKELREYIVFLESEMPVILFLDENAKDVTLNGSMPGFGSNYTVSGSEYSTGIKNYLTFLEQFYAAETELMNELNTVNPADSNAIKPLMASLDSISAIQRDYAVEHIMKDTASPVSWLLLRELIPASGLLGFDSTDLGYFYMVSNGMKDRYPNSEYTTYIDMDIESINSQLAAMRNPVTTSGKAPEIVLNDYNGKPIALSSLRGKVVLVDFWASWCGPCRQENPNVVRLYEQYKDKGFTVYSVSLDDNRDKWMKAIDADNLSWPNHVSDLKGWSSDAAIAYNVRSIPATFLLDKEGNIIAENVRGPQLEQKLQEILD